MKLSEIKNSLGDDKGFILILALVTMLAMTLIGLSVVMNMTTDMQLARNDREAKLAFQIAESGIKEATARLHLPSNKIQYIGEKSSDAGYRTTAWAGNSFGVSSGTSIDGLNYEVTLKYLDETNPELFCDSNNVGGNNSGNATVPPASCQNDPAEVVMYGQDFNLPSSVTSIHYGMLPVYRVVSVGTSNGTSRTIEAYVGASSLNTDTEYAINTNGCIDVAGAAGTITGQVQQGSTCTTCDPAVKGIGTCVANKTTATPMDTYLGDTLANIKGYADETHSCTTGTCNGTGDDIPSSGALDSVVTNWGSIPDNLGSLIYINNTGGKQVSISGNFSGEGIFIVTGDLKISGNFQFHGLVYVLGTLTVSGGGSNLNVTGGVMANNTVTVNGGINIQYSLPELQEVSRQMSTSSVILWKRL